jgi:hypothetical protein
MVNLLMLVIVLLAFTPSFYLRSQFSQPPILDMPRLPATFAVHGIILTSWYIFLVLQAGLIRFRKVWVHRSLGWAGLGLAIAVVISTMVVVFNFPKRMGSLSLELGVPVDQLEPGLAMILWMDIFMTILFCVFVAIGLLNRRRAEIHKRAMLFAGITYLFAATARLGGTVAFMTSADISLIINFLLLLVITSSLLVYDKVKLGRVSRMSWACFASYWLAMVVSNVSALRIWASRSLSPSFIFRSARPFS